MPRSRTSNIRSEVGDEEIIAKDRLDHFNGGRVGDEIAEQLVKSHEIEDANIAWVGVKELEVGLFPFSFNSGFRLPQTIKGVGCFLFGENGWDPCPSVLCEMSLCFSQAVRHYQAELYSDSLVISRRSDEINQRRVGITDVERLGGTAGFGDIYIYG